MALLSRVTQGCQPISKVRRVTAWEGHVITHLDDEPALDVLLSDLGVDLYDPTRAINAVRATLVGLTHKPEAMWSRGGQFGEEVMVRHILGLDPNRRAVAVSQTLQADMQLAFCRRDVQAAKADLLRIGAEIDPGVPWTRSMSGPDVALALKSGNFGTPDFFIKAWSLLR
mgnify:CR=1 FL=1